MLVCCLIANYVYPPPSTYYKSTTYAKNKTIKLNDRLNFNLVFIAMFFPFLYILKLIRINHNYTIKICNESFFINLQKAVPMDK